MLIGYIHFDKSGLPNNRSEMLITSDNARSVQEHSFVKVINSSPEQEVFFGRIIQGPFYHPEEVNRDSALAQTSILRGDSFPSVPNYYATATIELLGVINQGGGIFNLGIRPNPQSKVEKLADKDIKKILKLHEGDMIVAKLEGYSNVDVNLKSSDKTVLPRNIGIFGTVGSGKTNTAQVLIEEAASAQNKKWAVIVVDVEGEYVNMDEPSNQVELEVKIKRYDREFAGLSDFHIYHLVGSYSVRDRGTKTVFIKTDRIEPFMLSEILGLTEPQEGALFEAIEQVKRDNQYAGRCEARDPVLRGRVTPEGYTLEALIKKIGEALDADRENPIIRYASRGSLRPLLRKLWRLQKTGAFDREGYGEPIEPTKLIREGRVSVFDVSHTGTYEKNLFIAELLNKVSEAKNDNPNLPPTMIVIEEAHTFISRENKDKMAETIAILRNIARRGRKRWLSLCFISQQPSHLPNEIFELCNTRIIHTIKSENNLRVLKLTAGDIAEEIWSDIPTLGIGQAIIDSPQFREPLKINVRPCQTKRGLVE